MQYYKHYFKPPNILIHFLINIFVCIFVYINMYNMEVEKKRYKYFDGFFKIQLRPDGIFTLQGRASRIAEHFLKNADSHDRIELILTEMRQTDKFGNTHCLIINHYYEKQREAKEYKEIGKDNPYKIL